MELTKIVFRSGGYGSQEDVGSKNTSHVVANENCTMTADMTTFLVTVMQSTRGGATLVYLVPFAALCQMHPVPSKAATAPSVKK